MLCSAEIQLDVTFDWNDGGDVFVYTHLVKILWILTIALLW